MHGRAAGEESPRSSTPNQCARPPTFRGVHRDMSLRLRHTRRSPRGEGRGARPDRVRSARPLWSGCRTAVNLLEIMKLRSWAHVPGLRNRRSADQREPHFGENARISPDKSWRSSSGTRTVTLVPERTIRIKLPTARSAPGSSVEKVLQAARVVCYKERSFHFRSPGRNSSCGTGFCS